MNRQSYLVGVNPVDFEKLIQRPGVARWVASTTIDPDKLFWKTYVNKGRKYPYNSVKRGWHR